MLEEGSIPGAAHQGCLGVPRFPAHSQPATLVLQLTATGQDDWPAHLGQGMYLSSLNTKDSFALVLLNPVSLSALYTTKFVSEKSSLCFNSAQPI